MQEREQTNKAEKGKERYGSRAPLDCTVHQILSTGVSSHEQHTLFSKPHSPGAGCDAGQRHLLQTSGSGRLQVRAQTGQLLSRTPPIGRTPGNKVHQTDTEGNSTNAGRSR